MERVFVDHVSGGSIAFSMGGKMRRIGPGDKRVMMPLGVYIQNMDKLRLSDESTENVPRVWEETPEEKTEETINDEPEWTMRMSPEAYLRKFGEYARNSDLARAVIERREKEEITKE